MKKFLSLAVIGMIVIASSSSAFASNHVSHMATTKGGKHVAECAKKMNKGVSECVKLSECQKEM